MPPIPPRSPSSDRENLLKPRSSVDSLTSLPSYHDLEVEDEKPIFYTKTKSRWPCWKKACLGTLGGIVGLVVLLIAGGYTYNEYLGPERPESPGWYPSPLGGTSKNWEESYRKAQKMVSKMTLIEKVNVTTGIGWSQGMCVGNTAPAVHVGFPSLCLQDGPLGLRKADNATSWPAGLTAAATWNRDLIYQRGSLHAREARGKGIHIILGPDMGPLGRMPAGGRNWEGFGSDPYLQGVASAQTVRGIQDEHVIATAKHYILNEQEHFRQGWEWGLGAALSSNVDDRTLHELYLWPFVDSVKAGVGSVMCSYQLSNNTYTCENSKLLNGILKDELGFQGFVQSDWLAQRSGVPSVLAGMDMTMPGDGIGWMDGVSLLGPVLTRGVMNSSIPIERLNDMATRIVAAWYQMGQDSKENFPEDGPNFSSWTNEREGLLHPGSGGGEKGVVNKFVDVQDDHGVVARQIAMEGSVLVKNEGVILPLKRGAFGGKRIGIYGEDAGPGKGANFCEDRGCNIGTLATGWGSGASEFPYLIDPLSALEKAFNTSSDDVPEFTSILENDKTSEISESAKSQDLCFAFANADAGEGFITWEGIAGDRNDLFIQKGGDKVIQSVAANCANTVVVVHAVGPVILERWIEMPGVKAVVLANLPGQESGNALVEMLFGKNVWGKLPYTVGKSLEDYGPGAKIMYFPNAIPPQQTFSEGLYIDYRYFDKNNITPRYPFGFGLSYTTFEFSSPKLSKKMEKSPFPATRPDVEVEPPTYSTDLPPVDDVLYPANFSKVNKYIYPYLDSKDEVKNASYPYPRDYDVKRPLSPAGGAEGGNPSLWDVIAEVEVTVKNTGDVIGSEVVQVYVEFPENVTNDAGEAVDFPPRSLRGFDKIELEAGKSQKVKFELTRRDLSWWDIYTQNWRMPVDGKFTIWIGNSSRDTPVKVEF